MELLDPNSSSEEEPEKGCGHTFCSFTELLKCGGFLYSVLTASVMSLLVGTTITFPSFALLEFTQYSDPAFQFDTLMVDLFGVSVSK